MPDENDKTRAERNEDAGLDHLTPEIDVPPEGEQLWQWFFELSDGVARITDGYFHPINWSEFQAWQNTLGYIVLPEEFAILRAMDTAYRSERNSEQSDYRQRLKDSEETKGRGRRGRRGK